MRDCARPTSVHCTDTGHSACSHALPEQSRSSSDATAQERWHRVDNGPPRRLCDPLLGCSKRQNAPVGLRESGGRLARRSSRSDTLGSTPEAVKQAGIPISSRCAPSVSPAHGTSGTRSSSPALSSGACWCMSEATHGRRGSLESSRPRPIGVPGTWPATHAPASRNERDRCWVKRVMPTCSSCTACIIAST